MKLNPGIKHLWNLTQGYRIYLISNILCGMCRILVSLAFVGISKYIVDIATHQTTGPLSAGIACLVGCMLLQFLLAALMNRLSVSMDIQLTNQLRSQLLDHILKSRWSGRETYHSGDMLNRMQRDVDTVVGLLSTSLPSFFITLFQLIAAAAFLLYLDARMALIIVCIMPLALLFSKLYVKQMRRLTQNMRETDSRVQSHVQENLQHRTLLAVLERTTTVLQQLHGLQHHLKDIVLRRNTFSIFSSMMVQMGFSLGYLTAFSWGVYGLSIGTVTFGMLTAFLQLVSQVQRPVVEMSRQLPAFINAWTSMERLEDLFSLPLEEQGSPIQLATPIGIRLHEVSYRYPDSDKKILQRFSYDFQPGSLTAVLGETGSGKSTLVRLMLALFTPEEGSIQLYHQQEEMTVTPRTRSNFIYVPQGNTLISGTLRENLLLGNPQATEAQLHEALHTAAADFVFQLPQGLNTLCGESGTGLSEGQAQRIAIARALLRPGGILLLDEPTSSLDAETTQTLLHRLQAKLQDKTLILITHQSQTAQLCSQTVILKP